MFQDYICFCQHHLAVKMIMDTKSRQPLGFAYIWFTTEDSAELAVKEMNGKVCIFCNNLLFSVN